MNSVSLAIASPTYSLRCVRLLSSIIFPSCAILVGKTPAEKLLPASVCQGRLPGIPAVICVVFSQRDLQRQLFGSGESRQILRVRCSSPSEHQPRRWGPRFESFERKGCAQEATPFPAGGSRRCKKTSEGAGIIGVGGWRWAQT